MAEEIPPPPVDQSLRKFIDEIQKVKVDDALADDQGYIEDLKITINQLHAGVMANESPATKIIHGILTQPNLAGTSLHRAANEGNLSDVVVEFGFYPDATDILIKELETTVNDLRQSA